MFASQPFPLSLLVSGGFPFPLLDLGSFTPQTSYQTLVGLIGSHIDHGVATTFCVVNFANEVSNLWQSQILLNIVENCPSFNSDPLTIGGTHRFMFD